MESNELIISLEAVLTELEEEHENIKEELELLEGDILLHTQFFVDRMEFASDSALAEDVNAMIATDVKEKDLRLKISRVHKDIFETIGRVIEEYKESRDTNE